MIKYILATAALIYLGANVFYSQNLSPLYLGVLNNDKESIVKFLTKIKKQPEFPEELTKHTTNFLNLEGEVFAQELRDREMITNLEQILSRSPKARDILYSLYVLYQRENDPVKASEFLRRATEVDPTLND